MPLPTTSVVLWDRGLQTYLLSHIDSLRTAIWQTQTENFKKWRINQKVYDWAKQSYYTTYDGYISELKSFVNIHIPYLQRAFAERQATAIQQIENRKSVNSQLYYDLNGRRITSPDRKGIYIQNHHKIVRQ